MDLAGEGVDAGRDAEVGDDVELVADENRRRGQRGAAPQPPRDVRPGDVAGAVRAYRQQRRLLEAGRDVDQPVAEDRPGNVREAPGIDDLPDLPPRRRIVPRGPERADVDDLLAAADVDDDRRGVGLRHRIGPDRTPALLARPGVDGHEVGDVVAVDADDEPAVEEDGRPPVAVLRDVGETPAPQDVAGSAHGGGPGGPEVHVDPLAIRVEDRRGRSEAVLRVERIDLAAVEDLHVESGVSRLGVEGEQPERAAFVRVDQRGREPEPPVRHHRRRPPEARHRRLPGDVLGLAPRERDRLARRMSLPRRPAELRPVARPCGGSAGQHGHHRARRTRRESPHPGIVDDHRLYSHGALYPAPPRARGARRGVRRSRAVADRLAAPLPGRLRSSGRTGTGRPAASRASPRSGRQYRHSTSKRRRCQAVARRSAVR